VEAEAEASTDSSHYQLEFVLVRAVAVVETMIMVLFPDSRAEPEEGSFLSLLTPSPTAEQSVQTVAVVLPRQIKEERVEAVRAAVF
jgi:hypothetical protein